MINTLLFKAGIWETVPGDKHTPVQGWPIIFQCLAFSKPLSQRLYEDALIYLVTPVKSLKSWQKKKKKTRREIWQIGDLGTKHGRNIPVGDPPRRDHWTQ